MKKMFISFIIILFTPIVSFSIEKIEDINNKNAIYLDLNSLSVEQPIKEEILNGSVSMKSLETDYTLNPRDKEYETLLYKDVDRMQVEKKSVSKSLEKKVLKNTSVGASYSTTQKSGQLKDSVSVYSKYQKEHFGITTAYSQDRDKFKEQGISGGTVSFTPEISLNKHVKIKNVYSENMTSNKQKNEVVLSLRPFKDDRLDLDIAAGETFSNGSQPAQSQINICTKFRF